MSISLSLWLYRIMAYIVGVMLIVVFVSIPFDPVEKVVGPIHGALYIAYLAVSLNLVIRARLSWWTMLAMVTGGWIPFAAFIVEHWVTRRVNGVTATTS
jgi:integral membrane protein